MLRVLVTWCRDIVTSITRPDGWQFIVKVFAAIALLWPLVGGLRTYQESHLSRERDQAEQAYNDLVNQLGSDSQIVKVAAIRRIPDMMRRRVPASDKIALSDLVSVLLGFEIRRETIYHESARMLIRNLLKTPRQTASGIELEALIASLEDLGASGWYRGDKGQPAELGHELAWLFHADQAKHGCLASIAVPALREAKDYCEYNLMYRAQLPGVDLSGKILREADFREAKLTQSNLREADLSRARLDGADLQGAALITAVVQASLIRAKLNMASASLSDFSGADLREATLDGADLRGANLQEANLSGASLRGAKLAAANLRNSDLGDSILAEAEASGADLRGANMRHAILDRSNLSNVELRGVLGWDKIRSMKDTNIAGVKDLTPHEVSSALARGAVQIPEVQNWRWFRDAGYPTRYWRVFSRPDFDFSKWLKSKRR